MINVANDKDITFAKVSEELKRDPLLRLPFSPAIETRYEADTKRARAWNIRLTIPLGLTAYAAFTLTDADVLPDLGCLPVLLRLGVVTPVGVFAMWMCSRYSAVFREAFISVGITLTMAFPVLFMGLSHALLAPYTTLVVLLVSMFGNITMRLRFHWACFFTLMTLMCMGVLLIARLDFSAGIAVHIAIATLTCAGFGIVANNQLERAERRSYLLALKELLRSEQLSADKAMIAALSLTDPLTATANRRAFDARLRELWDARSISTPAFSLLMIDVDFFKLFNDHYGHPAGDICLGVVARILLDVVKRSEDLVARYGGEEFAVLLTNCDLGNAFMVGERIRAAINDACIEHENRPDGLKNVTISIGASSTQADGVVHSQHAQAFVANADRNLYEAKRLGRNRVFPALSH